MSTPSQLTGLSPFMRSRLIVNEDGSVKAPDNIIQTVSAAYQQYTTLRGEHLDRIAVYAAIEGMIGGNPPYDQGDLDANGLGHIANFNNFKARAEYERAAQALWNLVNSTEVLVNVELADEFPDSALYSEKIARNFSDVIRLWVDFEVNFNLLGAQLIKYGICPVFFPHENSPIWEVVDVARFYIPSDAQVFTSKLTNLCIDSTYTVQTLYQIYKGLQDDDDWNKEALGNFLLLRANSFLPTNDIPFTNMLDVERRIEANEAFVSQFYNDNVVLTNLLQQEYDGKVSHYIFSSFYFNNVQNQTGTTVDDFLFFVDRQYDCIDDAVVIFTASPGEWTIHANKGVGHKMYAGALAINQLDCTLVDMSKMSATPIIRSLATGGRNLEPIRFYPGVAADIGAAEFAQNNLGANIPGVVQASQFLDIRLKENAINAGDDPSMPDKSQGSLSPSQARAKDYKEFGPLKNVVSHFYNTFDKVVRPVFIRFLSMKDGTPGYEFAKEFKKRCLRDGVPEVLLDTAKKGLYGLPEQFKKVCASRVAGDGSTLARIMGLESLGPVMGLMDDQEIYDYKREYVTATMGVNYVPMFARKKPNDETSGGASLARTEDGLMALGKQPLFSPDNDQAAHADEHMGSAGQIVRAVAQQQMSPVDADKIMALAIPHIEQHIGFMMKSPQFYRNTLNGLNAPFKQLKQWAQLNRRNATAMIQAAMKKQQEDVAKTQAVMSDAERKDFVAQADVARADRKVEAQNERAAEANETRAEIMKTKVQKDADNKRLQVQLEAEAKQNATAKGRTQAALAERTPAQLSSDLDAIVGSTPSTVDFERLG